MVGWWSSAPQRVWRNSQQSQHQNGFTRSSMEVTTTADFYLCTILTTGRSSNTVQKEIVDISAVYNSEKRILVCSCSFSVESSTAVQSHLSRFSDGWLSNFILPITSILVIIYSYKAYCHEKRALWLYWEWDSTHSQGVTWRASSKRQWGISSSRWQIVDFIPIYRTIPSKWTLWMSSTQQRVGWALRVRSPSVLLRVLSREMVFHHNGGG